MASNPAEPRPIGATSALLRMLGYMLVGAYFVLGIGYIALRWYVWPYLDDWRPTIERHLGTAMGRPLQIGNIHTGFDGLSPTLTVSGLRVVDDAGIPLLDVPKAVGTVSLRTLWSGELRLAELRLVDAAVVVERVADGDLRVAGMRIAGGEGDAAGLDRLMTQRRVVVERGVIDWRDRVRGVEQRFEGIELALGNVGRRHRIAVSVRASGSVLDGADAVAEFFRPVRSRPSEWQRWQGEAYLGVGRFDAAALDGRYPGLLPLERGAGALRAWLRFDGGQPRDGLLKLAASDLQLRAPAPVLGLARLALELHSQPAAQAAGWDLKVARLALDDGQGLRVAGLGEQRLSLDESLRPRGGRLQLEELDTARALAFARRLPLDARTREAVSRLAVGGRLRAPAVVFSLASGLEFDASADFEGLSMRVAQVGPPPASPEGRPLPRVPGFANLSGKARVGHDRGELEVDARSATLFFPGLFEEEAIALDQLQARAQWTVGTTPDAPRLTVALPALRFANADAAGTASGAWHSSPRGGPGVIALEGRLERAQAARTARYLPQQLPVELRGWVARAVTAGVSDDVEFRLRGDLRDFPFHDAGTGDFRIAAAVRDGTLAYAPDWPPIERFDGRLLFERDGMDITMNSGRTFGVTLADTRARIAAYSSGLLTIDGGGQGPAADLVRFVNESPIATRIDDFTRDTAVDGPARLQLKLEMPLRDLPDSKVAGVVTFGGNDLQLDSTLPRFSGVTGRLEFSERGLALRQVAATFLGGPLRVEGETPELGRFVLRAQGAITAEDMRRVSDNVLTRKLTGSTEYSAELDVRRRAATVRIESDLHGLASALPPPFDKPADARWPLRVTAVPRFPQDPSARPSGDRISVELHDDVHLLFDRERRSRDDRMLIRRGSFAIGAEPVMPDSGFAVTLTRPEVDLDAWGALLADAPPQESQERIADEFAPGFSLLPTVVSVVSPRVRVARRDLHDVVFGASRLGAFWRANVIAREINGYFNWRNAAPGQPHGALNARFTRLEIPPSRRGEVDSLLDEAPETLPALELEADELVLNERRLGRLKLSAANEGAGAGAGSVWNLRELRIEHPSATLEATGAWATERRGAGSRATRLDFALTTIDSGELLSTFGFHDVLRGGAGRLEGRIGWVGSPLSIAFPSLQGEIRTALGAGQFVKTEPGIAKLIGVVNLQALPRRLSLDFRDVLAEGFAFDRIDGDVRIDRGVARTDDLTMIGLGARVRLSGEADIAHETQSLEVEIRPTLNAGLASLAYAAMANPALGLGSFLAQLVLRRPLETLFTYEYTVRGSWADPQVSERRRYPNVAPSGP